MCSPRGSGDGKDDGEDEKKRQKRGGKGMMRAKKKEEVEKKICLSRAPRGKRKSVTVITGLSTFGETVDRREFSDAVMSPMTAS